MLGVKSVVALFLAMIAIAQLSQSANVPVAANVADQPKGPFTCPDGTGWACWADVQQRDELCDSRGWNERWAEDHWFLGTCYCCKA